MGLPKLQRTKQGFEAQWGERLPAAAPALAAGAATTLLPSQLPASCSFQTQRSRTSPTATENMPPLYCTVLYCTALHRTALYCYVLQAPTTWATSSWPSSCCPR